MSYYSKKKWIVLTAVFGGLATLMSIAVPIVVKKAGAALNMVFNTSNYKTIVDNTQEPQFFFKSDKSYLVGNNKYKDGAAEKLRDDDNQVIYNAELEGATLLWNKSSALPLAGNEYVNLLSHSSVDYVRGGSGSGYVKTVKSTETDETSSNSISTSMYDAFSSKGFTVNKTLWDFYNSSACKNYTRTSPGTNCKQWQQWSVNEVPWSVYGNNEKASFANANKDSVAIITLSRTGGEYSDLHYNYSKNTDTVGGNQRGEFENTPENNGYLGLTNEEDSLFNEVIKLKQNGTFKKVIVLLNTGNPIRFTDLVPYYNDIDACMWIGQPGSYGINAVVDLLKGKESPSGHITDTFMYDLNSAPSTLNDGNYIYKGDLSKLYKSDSNYYNTYMVYQEGIYVGYRYYETRYEDCVLSQGNAQSSKGKVHSSTNWNYAEEVAFPFGYGESYSKFEFSNYDVTLKNDTTYEVSVDVKNIGEMPAKEAVQVYLQKPYTDYDILHKVEKASIELAGYTKTKKLAKNETQTVKIEVPREYFKTYDANGAKTYIIEGGDYYLAVGNNAHNALNNILKLKSPSSIISDHYFENYNLFNKPVSECNENFAKRITLEDDFSSYKYSTQTNTLITNQLDDGDLNKYINAGSNKTTYLSRSNWDETYPTTQEVTMTAGLAQDLMPDIEPESTGEMPTYNKFVSGSKTSAIVDAGDVVAYQFMDAPLYPENHLDDTTVYSDGLKYTQHWEKMWNQLLDEMSFEEQALIAANAYHQVCGASSIALPSSKQENGPVGITKRAESTMNIPDANIKYYFYVSYPSAQVIAASFNDKIAEEVGKEKSEDMLYLGYNGIYGPGVNMHRSPYAGRAYEYPSEDPLLSGQIEYNESVGIESKGCIAYAKHFVMNDSETNRAHVAVWSNEQASREIYCRAFEIVFAQGGAHGTMNGFNRIGPKWNGACYEMQTSILRKEWGWEGINISDWRNDGQNSMSFVQGIMAGINSFDGNGSSDDYAPYRNNATVCRALRESAKYVIYNIVRTNVMNGLTLNSKVIEVSPWWETALVMVRNVFFVLTAFAALTLLLCILIPIINKNKKEPEETKLLKKMYKENSKERFFVDFKTKFKVISSVVAGVVLCCLILAIVIPIANSHGNNGEIKERVQFVYPENDNSIRYDEGPNESHIFEIEKFTLSGKSTGKDVIDETSTIENANFSNGKAIANLENDSTISLAFVSDTYAIVETSLGVVAPDANTNLSDMLSIVVNDVEIDLNNIVVDKNNSGSEYGVSPTTVFIPLDIGLNSLKFIVKNQFTGLDYIDIQASSTLTPLYSEIGE